MVTWCAYTTVALIITVRSRTGSNSNVSGFTQLHRTSNLPNANRVNKSTSTTRIVASSYKSTYHAIKVPCQQRHINEADNFCNITDMSDGTLSIARPLPHQHRETKLPPRHLNLCTRSTLRDPGCHNNARYVPPHIRESIINQRNNSKSNSIPPH